MIEKISKVSKRNSTKLIFLSAEKKLLYTLEGQFVLMPLESDTFHFIYILERAIKELRWEHQTFADILWLTPKHEKGNFCLYQIDIYWLIEEQ